jgi:hypothetical protein
MSTCLRDAVENRKKNATDSTDSKEHSKTCAGYRSLQFKPVISKAYKIREIRGVFAFKRAGRSGALISGSEMTYFVRDEIG